MAEESAQEKTEEPTAKRLEKAREDGQVARSQELGVATMMIGSAVFMYLFGAFLMGALVDAFATSFVFDRRTVFSADLLPAAFGDRALISMLILLPFFGLTAVIAAGSGGIIGGFIFSLKSLVPKASKLNPLTGLKRMFGLQALVGLTKALLKFLLVGGVL